MADRRLDAEEQLLDRGESDAALRVRRLVMALDGSAHADRVLGDVVGMARAIGAEVDAIEVVPSRGSSGVDETAITAILGDGHFSVVEAEDPVDGLVAAFGFGEDMVGCIATHGRDHSASLLGSVAVGVLDQVHEPLLLAGPGAGWRSTSGAPVVAALDGTADDRSIVATACGWAQRLSTRLHLVTVAEPVPDAARSGQSPRRRHGPDEPEQHLATMSRLASESGVEVTWVVRYDPVVVAPAIVETCREEQAALVVIGARRHSGLRRLVLGDHATRIVHESPALVLAVPVATLDRS